MKKRYTKPEIIFEDFSLSTNIAASCAHQALHARNQCAYVDEFLEEVIFTDSIPACITIQQDDGNNGICYHVPTGSSNIFAS